MDMASVEGESAYAVFREFRVADEYSDYKLHLRFYNGTAGTGLHVAKKPLTYTEKHIQSVIEYFQTADS